MAAKLAAAIRMSVRMALSSAKRVRSSLSSCTYTLSANADRRSTLTEVVQLHQLEIAGEPFCTLVQPTRNTGVPGMRGAAS